MSVGHVAVKSDGGNGGAPHRERSGQDTEHVFVSALFSCACCAHLSFAQMLEVCVTSFVWCVRSLL